MNKTPKSRGNALLWILMIGLVAVFCFGGWKLWSIRQEYRTGTDAYASLAQTAIVPAEPSRTEPEKPVAPTKPEPADMPEEPEPLPEEPEVFAHTVSFQVDFAPLLEINGDTVAWIRSDTGEIDYPVVQGADNDYYLNHLFDGTVNKNGTIFVDARNTPGFEDSNTIIYGHNMLNGAIFATLPQYSTAGYYEAHPTLELVTPDRGYILEVFSGYTVSSSADVYRMTFSSGIDYADYLVEIRQRSEFESPVEMAVTDKMVTLSTCVYQFSGARYVLHCKLLRANLVEPAME